MDDQTALNKAIKVIGGHKAQITRARALLDTVIAAGSVAAADVAKVRSAKTMVERQSSKIEAQIDDLLGNELFTAESQDGLTDYLLDTGNLVEQVTALLEEKPVAKPGNVSILDATSIGEALSESLIQAHIKQPLPPIEIPQFNGQHSEFTPFWESFNYLVHENENYPDVIKATYLQRAMKEKTPAYELLKHFSPTADNYKLMREKLEKRFKLGYLTKSLYINNLKKLGTWKPCTTAVDLRKLLDYINENMELLKLSGGSDMHDSDFLLTDVSALIPKFIVNHFLDLPEKDRNFRALLDKMETSVEKMAERDVLVPKTPKQNSSYSNNRGFNNRNSNYSSSYQKQSTYHTSEQENCFFCGKQHSATTCNTGTVQERLAIAKERWLCHNCLFDGHMSADCKHESYCKCGRRSLHCKALCFGNGTAPSNANDQPRGRGNGNPTQRGRGKYQPRGRGRGNSSYKDGNNLAVNPDMSSNAIADSECFMEIGCGYVQSATSDGYEKVRFLFDSASNASYGKRSCMDRIKGVKVGERNLEIDTFGEGEVKCQSCDIVKLVVRDPNDFHVPTEICISVTDSLCRDVPTWQLTPHQMQSIRNYQLSDSQQISGNRAPIDVLIGLDNYWKFMHRRTDDPGFGPKLRSSKLGWILSGQRDFANPRLLTTTSNNPLTQCVQTLLTLDMSSVMTNVMSDKLNNESVYFANKSFQSESDSELSDEEQYNALFSDLETFGIKPEQEISPILSSFNDTIRFDEEEKRYVVRLPMVGRLVDKMEDNYDLSKTRLDSLFTKIRNPAHSEFAKKYYAIIEEQERLRVIERVSDMSKTKHVCYIPHHGVTKAGSDKLRIVYDGSAKSSKDKTSLNECLSAGPSLTNELIAMLMRFRTHNEVLTGDIMKAFLQIIVALQDRDYLRFLWYDTNGELVVYRFTRVPFGLTCSSFLLNATLRYHMEQKCKQEGNQDLLERLGKSHYVDDWIVGARTPEEVLLIKRWLTEFLESIGMKLHKLNSNSPEVRQQINAECPEQDSVLGVPWCTTSDEIAVNVQNALQHSSKPATKCELYSAPARVFDPLGFCQPFMFQAKLLFQECCSAKIKWKDKLPSDLRDKFDKWKSQIPELAKIRIPRQVLLPNFHTVELHGFGDASQLGYCACVYMVSRNSTISVSRLIACKTRVAPLKKMTIPRLELTAAFLLARLMALVIKFHESLNFYQVVYYSDNTTTLHWIKSIHKDYNTYVDNRTTDINFLSSPDDWKYVRTDLNPADLGTRGIDAADLINNDKFYSGPGFLVSNDYDSSHDLKIDFTHPTAEALKERRKMVNVVTERTEPVIFRPKVDGSRRKLSDYSSIDKVLNVTGYLYKFIAMKMSADRFARFVGYAPSSEFRKLAQERWVRWIQMEHYEKEVNFCRNNPKVIPSGLKVVSSRVQQLRLFLDDHGVLRVNTLLHNADIPDTAKEPILLPKHSHLTTIIIWKAHDFLKHELVDATLAEVQQVYYIPQGRQAIRNVLRQCVRCRMQKAGPYPTLAQPQLPDFRVQRVEVFTSAGVDFAGPLSIKGAVAEYGKKKKEKKDKRRKEDMSLPERMVYLIIFTCAVSRMVHAEVLDGMTVTDFMHGLRRFISKYGPPQLFYSDNAKTFQCVSRELPLVLNNPKLHKYLHDREITWKFYVQKAPWMGGFIEKVVGLFKCSVSRVVGRAMLDFQEFLTLIYEVNAVLNSRPISYVYDTVGEEGPITPSKLWCGKNITLFPPFYEARIDNKDPEICKKRLKYLDKILTHVWKRFSRSYLTSLSERHLSRNLPMDGRQPKVGEVVLIKNDKMPRGRWKIARVKSVTPGRDGVIRRVELQPAYNNLSPDTKKNEPSEVLYRPPRLLIPLECEVDNESE